MSESLGLKPSTAKENLNPQESALSTILVCYGVDLS